MLLPGSSFFISAALDAICWARPELMFVNS